MDIELLYNEWSRLHCGPREMVALIRKPLWRRALSVPRLWRSHYCVARRYTGVYQSARLASLFSWAVLTA